MIDKVFVLNRVFLRNLTLGINVFRYVKGFDSKKPFILISSFGNVILRVKDNPSLQYTPNTLIRDDFDLSNLKELGMVDYVDVFCDDITTEQYEKLMESKEYIVKLFDEQNAIDIENFINKHIGGDDLQLIVHCDAGISRSGAIATAICEHYNITKEYIHENIHPNPTILDICKNTWK